jgi:hypothetical protein
VVLRTSTWRAEFRIYKWFQTHSSSAWWMTDLSRISIVLSFAILSLPYSLSHELRSFFVTNFSHISQCWVLNRNHPSYIEQAYY